MEYVITFKNTNFAIKAEQCLLKEKLSVAVMPLPSQIRAGCGICLRILPEEINLALEILKKNNINEIGLFAKTGESGNFIYAEIDKQQEVHSCGSY